MPNEVKLLPCPVPWCCSPAYLKKAYKRERWFVCCYGLQRHHTDPQEAPEAAILMTGIVEQGVGVPPSGSGHSAEPEPCSTVSAVPVSVPNAARSTVANTICKPFTVNGNVITSANIARAIDMLANLPDEFAAFRLATTLLPEGSGWDRQEATNRLMQRWRKLGLVSFGRRWSLARGAWDKLQASAIDARSELRRDYPAMTHPSPPVIDR